jgi:segregation and condensation protein B
MSSQSETITETTAEAEVENTEEVESVASQASNDDSASPVRLNLAPLDLAKVKNITEAALMAAGQPLSIDRLLNLFMDENQPSREELRAALKELADECEPRGIELVEVGSGFRYQAKQENAEWVARLWEEKPARYSRALLETLSLIAYRQPITRGEIEDIRGVSVSTNIMKTLMERDWVKVVGHRDVPGKPAMYASTKQFLDYFGLKSLSDLPSLAEIRDIDSINAELDLAEPGSEHVEAKEQTGAEVIDETGDEAVAEVDVTESADTSEAAETEASEPSELNTAEDNAEAEDVIMDEASDSEEDVEMNSAEHKAVTAADPA